MDADADADADADVDAGVDECECECGWMQMQMRVVDGWVRVWIVCLRHSSRKTPEHEQNQTQ